MIFMLAATAFVVGVLIGLVGIGGILLIPAISAFSGMPTREAMATALFSFLFTALWGTWMFARRGSIDWTASLPVSLGALVFGYFGALTNSRANSSWLNLSLSLVIIFAGAYVLKPVSAKPSLACQGGRSRFWMLSGVGAVVGFVSGLTGVGGPVLSVPIMIALGVAPLTSIAAGQVIQVAAAGSGTLGNIMHGVIDYFAAFWLTIVQLAGLALGISLAHRLDARRLRKMVALVCLVIGGFILARSLLGMLA